MPTQTVVLTEHQEEIIENLVRSGEYRDASEVVAEGLHLIEQREAENAAKLEILRDAARTGFAALDQGNFKQFETIGDLQAYLSGLAEKIISKTSQ